MNNLITVARPIAPEDIVPGATVAVLSATVECMPYWAIESPCDIDRVRTLRWSYVPKAAGRPLKVLSVCLPFVYVATMKGGAATLDVRRCSLVELSPEYVKAVRKRRAKARKRAAAKQSTPARCDTS